MPSPSLRSRLWTTSELIQRGILYIGDGYRAKNSEMGTSGLPFARAGNINGGFQFADADILAEQSVVRAGDKVSRTGDVVFTSKGTVGRFAFVRDTTPRFVYSPQLCFWRVLNISVLNPRFLFYWMHTNAFLNQVQCVKGLTDMADYVSLADQRRMTIAVPDMDTQGRIAAALSLYDDLIENNTRRIKILEQMAQMLYREWFVNFRFPGHEKVKVVESELGPIPEGWSVKPLGEVATVTMGLSPKGDTYNEDGDGVPLINGPVEFGDKFAKAVKWTTAPTKICRDRDLIVCVRGSTTGRYVKSDGTYCLGRGVCSVSSEYQCFVDLLFQDQLPVLLAQTSGSTFPSWTGPQLKSHLVLCPPSEMLQTFETQLRPLSSAVHVYSRQTHNLRTTRDLLLPKLVSGEISVEQIEKEAVAQMV